MLRFGAVGVGLVYGSIKMSYYKVLPGLQRARNDDGSVTYQSWAFGWLLMQQSCEWNGC